MNKLRIVTYNIDGLPEVLDLKELPWYLKPICWIYRLFKGTTFIKINDNEDVESRIKSISEYLVKLDADIIGVQENFNYNNELISNLQNKYMFGNYRGGIDFSNIRWLPYPKFKTDGLTFMSKIPFDEVDTVKWNKSCGYISSANDLLIEKGFRLELVKITDDLYLDVYLLHMDADFCNIECSDSEVRGLQLKQLVDYIIKRDSHNPIIIMGDTNSSPYYSWDIKNINIELLHRIEHVPTLHCKEAVPSNCKDVDRIFFINNNKSKYKLELEDAHYDSIILSDHRPLVVTFKWDSGATG